MFEQKERSLQPLVGDPEIDSLQYVKEVYNDLSQKIRKETEVSEELNENTLRLLRRKPRSNSLKKLKEFNNTYTYCLNILQKESEEELKNPKPIASNAVRQLTHFRRLKRYRRETLQPELAWANTPGGVQSIFSHLWGPAAILLLISTIVLTYASVSAMTAGGSYMCAFATAVAFSQALKYLSNDGNSLRSHMGSIGRVIDEFIADFDIHRLWHQYKVSAAKFIAFLLSGALFAAFILSIPEAIVLLAALPAIHQVILLVAAGYFLASTIFHASYAMIRHCASGNDSSDDNNAGLMETLFVDVIGVLFLGLITVAEVCVALGTLAAILNLGFTAYFCVAAYALIYFSAQQITFSSKLHHVGKVLDNLSWQDIYDHKYTIFGNACLALITIGLAGMCLFPPTAIAPTVTYVMLSIGVKTLPFIEQAMVTIGLATCLTLMIPKLLSAMAYIYDKLKPAKFKPVTPVHHSAVMSLFKQPEENIVPINQPPKIKQSADNLHQIDGDVKPQIDGNLTGGCVNVLSSLI